MKGVSTVLDTNVEQLQLSKVSNWFCACPQAPYRESQHRDIGVSMINIVDNRDCGLPGSDPESVAECLRLELAVRSALL